jgi:type VI secretion system protein ImpH
VTAGARPPVADLDPLEAMMSTAPNGANGHPKPEAKVGEPKVRKVTSRVADHQTREEFLTDLAYETWNYNFYQVVRRLDSMFPDLQGIGLSDKVEEDPIRFCQQPTLAFPPNTVTRYDPPTSNAPGRLFVAFMGLLGPHGPLPLHLAEYALEREIHFKDRTFSRFLDVFNHRLVSLFYRAWSVNQMPASYDRSFAAAGMDPSDLKPGQRQRALLEDDDPYAIYIGSLLGIGMDSLRLRDVVPDTAKLHFAGRLAAGTPGPEGLRGILQEYFGVPVMIDEFAGQWLDLPKDQYCRLGGDPVDRTPSSLGGPLGGAVAGSRVWDCQGKFRIRLGPMGFEDYQRFLPHTKSAARLEGWIRNFVGDEFAWEAQIILRQDEVPKTQLGKGAALGWSTWMYSGNAEENRADLTIRSRN